MTKMVQEEISVQNPMKAIGTSIVPVNRLSVLLIALVTVFVSSQSLFAQEMLAPLSFNPIQYNANKNYEVSKNSTVSKTTALSLPFFEDFTSYSPIPDDSKWLDGKVYVNNTMCFNPISRGVATFDALDQDGIPYDPVSNTTLLYADSLTSQQIDLSGYQASDSLYFSFFYQPEGNGFYPEPEDSLMLYMRNTRGWVRVWKVPGERTHEFKQVMIPITEASYFHTGFQFRFVNKASIVVNDDVWNVDYIRLDANRNINDTLVEDVAFTLPPTFFLSDYTYMPYHQFLADVNQERAVEHSAIVRNNSSASHNLNYNFVATENVTASNLASNTNNTTSLAAGAAYKITESSYTNLPTTPQMNHPRVFKHKYYIESVGANDPRGNDTIIHEQNFHNFLAYDDGTAEKSYFLNLFATLPGKIAIDFHLNEPDTLSAVSIYFGRQVPLPDQKFFSIIIYSDIDLGGGSDQVLYQEDFLKPVYSQVNHSWVYKLQQPVALPSGKFYVGTMQPALSNSDSLYFGFDVNRDGENHLYYNVLDEWKKSNLSGALMIRPMFGTVFPSSIEEVDDQAFVWDVAPNPTQGDVIVSLPNNQEVDYTIVDMQGQVLQKGLISNGEAINTQNLPSGTYFVRLQIDGVETKAKKLIKY